MNKNQINVLVTIGILAVLFILLSPGVVLNLPPHKNKFKTKNIFFTGETGILSVIVHSLVFAVAAYFLLTNYTLVKSQVVETMSNIASNTNATVSTAATTALIAATTN